jgi:hypothetical protein
VSFLDGSIGTSADTSDPALQRVEQHVAQFGEAYARSFLAAVPEPTSAIAACGLALLSTSRRRRQQP